MIYSIIQKSQLEGANRIDAEYYQPEYFIDFSKGNWQSIGEVLELCQYGISQAMTEESIGFPIFRMNDINDAFLVDNEVKFVNLLPSLFTQYKLENGDVLFNRVNAENFVGRTGIFKLKKDYVFASYLIRIRPKKDSNVLPDYLNIFLNSSFGKRQIKKFMRRAVNQANVNAEELKQMKIAVLPKEFQKLIEKTSNKVWNHIELSKILYSQAEELLLEELGLNDFKFSKDLSYIVNFSDIQSADRMDAEYFQPKYEELTSKLKSQNAKALGELASIKKGFEPGSKAYQEEGKLFIRVSSLSKYGIDNIDQKYVNKELYEKLKKDFQPQIGEILLTKDATPGIAYVLKEPIEGIISGGILRLELIEKIEPEYLALCINSLIGQMQAERDAGGSIIEHWRPEQIKNLIIPILPQSTQQKIAELVRKSHETRKKSKELLEEAKRKVEEMIEKNVTSKTQSSSQELQIELR